MHWGELQRECHRLIEEGFESKKLAYKWLADNFGVTNFSKLNHKEDIKKLRAIYDKLYTLSVLEQDPLEELTN